MKIFRRRDDRGYCVNNGNASSMVDSLHVDSFVRRQPNSHTSSHHSATCRMCKKYSGVCLFHHLKRKKWKVEPRKPTEYLVHLRLRKNDESQAQEAMLVDDDSIEDSIYVDDATDSSSVYFESKVLDMDTIVEIESFHPVEREDEPIDVVCSDSTDGESTVLSIQRDRQNDRLDCLFVRRNSSPRAREGQFDSATTELSEGYATTESDSKRIFQASERMQQLMQAHEAKRLFSQPDSLVISDASDTLGDSSIVSSLSDEYSSDEFSLTCEGTTLPMLSELLEAVYRDPRLLWLPILLPVLFFVTIPDVIAAQIRPEDFEEDLVPENEHLSSPV